MKIFPEPAVILGMVACLFLSACLSGDGATSDDGTTGSGTADTAAPTLTTLKDSDGNAIDSTGSTVSTASGFLLTFSEALKTDSIGASSVTLTCDDTAVEGSVTASVGSDEIADNEFTFSPTANLSQVRSCTLTVAGGAEGVQDASENTLAADATYEFTTGCAASDDFGNSGTLEACYLLNGTSNHTNQNTGSSGAAAVTVEGGQLKFDLSPQRSQLRDGVDTVASAMKTVSSGDFTLDMTVASVSDDDGNTEIDLFLISSYSSVSGFVQCYFSWANGCGFLVADPSAPLPTNTRDSACAQGPIPADTTVTATPNITLRLRRSGSSINCLRKLSGETEFTAIGLPAILSQLSGEALAGVVSQTLTATGVGLFLLDDLAFSTGSVTGQE